MTFPTTAPVRRDQGAPHIKFIAGIRDRKILAHAAFSYYEPALVRDVRFEYSKDKNEIVGSEERVGQFNSRVGSAVRFPVVMRFVFDGRACTVSGYAGFLPTDETFTPRCE